MNTKGIVWGLVLVAGLGVAALFFHRDRQDARAPEEKSSAQAQEKREHAPITPEPVASSERSSIAPWAATLDRLSAAARSNDWGQIQSALFEAQSIDDAAFLDGLFDRLCRAPESEWRAFAGAIGMHPSTEMTLRIQRQLKSDTSDPCVSRFLASLEAGLFFLQDPDARCRKLSAWLNGLQRKNASPMLAEGVDRLIEIFGCSSLAVSWNSITRELLDGSPEKFLQGLAKMKPSQRALFIAENLHSLTGNQVDGLLEHLLTLPRAYPLGEDCLSMVAKEAMKRWDGADLLEKWI